MCRSAYVPTPICLPDASTYTAGITRSLERVPETGRWRFMDISPKYESSVRAFMYDMR